MNKTSKELLEAFEKIGVTNKTHSSSVTPDQIRRLETFLAEGGVKKADKPKAFVVKKAKVVEEEPKVQEAAPKEENKKTEKPIVEKVNTKVEVVKPTSRLEIVRKASKKPEDARSARPERPVRKPFNKSEDKKFPPRGENSQDKDKRSPSGQPKKDFSNKSCIPRQIPKIGIFPAKCLMASSLIPASRGCPGPGLTTSRVGFRASNCSMLHSFERTT